MLNLKARFAKAQIVLAVPLGACLIDNCKNESLPAKSLITFRDSLEEQKMELQIVCGSADIWSVLKLLARCCKL